MKLQNRLQKIVKNIKKNDEEKIILIGVLGVLVGILSTTIFIITKDNNESILDKIEHKLEKAKEGVLID